MNKRIAILANKGSYALDSLVACSPLNFNSLAPAGSGLPAYQCPYDLPAIDSGTLAVLDSGYLSRLKDRGADVTENILKPLREKFDYVIAIDQADSFSLETKPDELVFFDFILKVNGIFKDADLYNYLVGSLNCNAAWTEKVIPKDRKFGEELAKKLRLSVPCFFSSIPAVRQVIRKFYVKSKINHAVRNGLDEAEAFLFNKLFSFGFEPRHTIHFLASLTHYQRITAMRIIKKSSISHIGGITGVPEWIAAFGENGIIKTTEKQREDLKSQLLREKILAKPFNRLRYLLSMKNAKAVLSISGYGELCFRMAEAWQNKKILVCQDMSHVETMFPFENWKNVIFCRPDLSDLSDLLEDIECNYKKYQPIAEKGAEDWLSWSRNWKDTLEKGFSEIYKLS